MSKSGVVTKKELVEHIEHDWLTLDQLLDRLSAIQWTEIKDANGWTIKDHLVHLTAWERSVIALLTGKPRHEGLQIAENLYLSGNLEAINDAVFQQHRNDPLDQVRSQFRMTHEELVGLIERLSTEDLNKPYIYFLPNEPGEGDGPLAIKVIYGNTAAHYREHQAWIEEILVST